MALAGCVLLGYGAACGFSEVDGDPISRSLRLPDRSKDAGADAEEPTIPAPDLMGQGGKDAGPPPSTTCAASDLALCFAFEGSTTDQSAAPLTPAVMDNITFVPGREGQAALFSTTSALRFAPSPVFELPATAATIEAWIKRDNTGADAVIFDDDGRFSLTINAAGHAWCKSSGGALIGAKLVPIGQWSHVACVIDGATMHVYVDGVEDVSGPGSVGSSPTAAAAIGGNSPDGEPFVGAMDSFRVFRVARSPAQIAAAAAATTN